MSRVFERTISEDEMLRSALDQFQRAREQHLDFVSRFRRNFDEDFHRSPSFEDFAKTRSSGYSSPRRMDSPSRNFEQRTDMYKKFEYEYNSKGGGGSKTFDEDHRSRFDKKMPEPRLFKDGSGIKFDEMRERLKDRMFFDHKGSMSDRAGDKSNYKVTITVPVGTDSPRSSGISTPVKGAPVKSGSPPKCETPTKSESPIQEKKVEELQQKLADHLNGYKNLPDDLNAAKAKIKEKRDELEKLESEFNNLFKKYCGKK